MLKKENRLKNKYAFLGTYKQNQSVSDGLFVLYKGRLKTEQQQDVPTKFGFVISKKISKRAVKRNKIKRLLRENIRLILKENSKPQLNKYLSIIFQAKSSAADNIDFKEIQKSVTELINKI